MNLTFAPQAAHVLAPLITVDLHSGQGKPSLPKTKRNKAAISGDINTAKIAQANPTLCNF